MMGRIPTGRVDSGPHTKLKMSTPGRIGGQPDWPWPDSLDAAIAAPDSHAVLLENDQVRVVRVYIPPGTREPEHTHRWASVMIVDRPARIRYYDAQGELAFESPKEIERTPRLPSWLPPEGPHCVENVDTTAYYAYRIELKRAAAN